jgi:hypothetical protein
MTRKHPALSSTSIVSTIVTKAFLIIVASFIGL